MNLLNNGDSWTLEDLTGDRVYRGTLTSIKKLMLGFGVLPEEFELAISSLKQNRHSKAHFGDLRGSLIYTE